MTLFEKRDSLIKEIIKPIFKENGFRITGTNFRKKEEDFIKIFNIQSSSWNSDGHVSFYLNIGFLFPIFYELSGNETPKNPKEYDCIFRMRSDSLTSRNSSYEILPKTDFNELKYLIESDLKHHVIPFFNRYENVEDCLKLKEEFEEEHDSATPYIGLTLLKNGDETRGNKILNEFIRSTHEEYAETLNEHRKQIKLWKHEAQKACL